MPFLRDARSACLLGVVGALLMAVGDLLMLGVPLDGVAYAAAGLELMAELPVQRIVIGGTVAPVGALLQGLAAAACLRLLPDTALRPVVTFGLLGLAAVAGCVHLSFAYMGVLVHAGPEVAPVWPAVLLLEAVLLVLGAAAGLPAAIGLAVAVGTGRSPLPRAAVLATPLSTIPILSLLGLLLPAPVGGPLLGAAFNLGMALWWGTARHFAPAGPGR
ncbi:MAG: hypothetical protein H6742_03590 [Alphaproteobacteria bacterium]|nr:hypothetical protein [Alphaproteobacteria bacterium]